VPVLVGIVLSYATLVAGMPGVGAALDAADADRTNVSLCALGEMACEAPSATDELDVYATPAEVDCRALQLQGLERTGPGAVSSGVASAEAPSDRDPATSACNPLVLDFRYRVSRVAESEKPNGALRPQRARRAGRLESTCTGLPLEQGSPVSPLSMQPIAMYALAGLAPPVPRLTAFEAIAPMPTRGLEPLERPPRA
jgi:hypothetical protein